MHKEYGAEVMDKLDLTNMDMQIEIERKRQQVERDARETRELYGEIVKPTKK